MLSASVDTLIWFLMEKADKAVLFGSPFHYFHGQLVVVNSQIGSRVNDGQLVL